MKITKPSSTSSSLAATPSAFALTNPLNQRRSRFLTLLAGITLLSAFLFVPDATAATRFWKGTGTWTAASQWGSVTGGPYTLTWAAGDDAVFDVASSTATGGSATFTSITANQNVTMTAGGTLNPVLIAPVTVASGMTFDFNGQSLGTTAGTGINKKGPGTLGMGAASAYPGGFTLDAGTVTIGGVNSLGAGGPLVINGGQLMGNSGAARDLSGKPSSITVGGDFSFGGTALLTFNAPTALGGVVRTITCTNTTTTVILGGVLSGTAGTGLTKNGAGQMTLTNANSGYGGNINIKAGTLSLSTSASAGGAGTIFLGDTTGSSAATLTFGSTLNFANNVTVNAGSSGIKTLGTHTVNTITNSGIITANDDLTISQSFPLVLTISGAANTIATTKTVTFLLTAASPGGITDSAIWGGLGKTAYGGNNTGGFVVSGAKSYSGGATLNAMSSSGLIAVTTSTTGPANAPTTGPFGTGTLSIGATKLRSTTTADTTIGNPITFIGDPTFPTLASERSFIFTGNADLGAATRTITNDLGTTVAGKTADFQGVISGTGSAGITKAGTGTLTLSGGNTYPGATTISGGSLSINSIKSVGGVANSLGQPVLANATISIGATATAGTLIYTGTGDTSDRVINLAGTTGGATITQSGASGLLKFSSALTATGVGVKTLTLQGSTAGSGEIGSAIVDSSSATALTKAGTGTWTLSGANTYTGTTTVSGGVLRLDLSTALPGGIDATVGAGESPLTLNGGVLGLGSGNFSRADGAGAGQVQWTSSGGFAAFGADRTVSIGTINMGTAPIATSTIILGHSTADAMIIWANNISFAGGARTIQVNDGSAAIDARISGALLGGGTFNKTGTGTLQITSSSSSYTAGTVVAAGTLQLGLGGTGGSIASTPSISVSASATFAVNQSDTVTQGTEFTPIISGGGAFAQLGSGTTSLTLANTYDGGTTISAGTLRVNNTTGSGTGTGAVTVNGGTLGGTGTISGPVTVNSSATLAAGASIGTLTLGGAATNNGTLVAEISSGPSADKVVFNGSFHNLGGTLTVTNVGSLASGTYDLFDFNGGAPTGVAFAATNLPGGPSHWNTSDLLVGGTITLANNAPAAANFDLGVAVGGTVSGQVVGKFATDPDTNDVLTIISVSAPANGTVSIVGGTNITYVSTNSAAGDSFTYTVSDGLASATATVTVSIYNPEGFNRLSPPSVIGPGTVTLSYLGIPGYNYALDHTTNLTPPIVWSAVITNIADPSNGSLSFTNTSGEPVNFFRTRYVP